MPRIYSFPPIVDYHANRLILGSMPGIASLQAQQYYAHARNLFWPIMGELVGATPTLEYTQRIEMLQKSGIALWDVLQSCLRVGSLDSAIATDSLIPNDFAAFFAQYPHIRRVYFNGTKAENCFHQHVLPSLPNLALQCSRLPSTSPAHAALSYAQKLVAWRAVMDSP